MRFFVHDITVGEVTVPLRCYIPDVCGETSYAGHRPAVIIFPGGGYCITYHGEAEPIALKYAAAGICTFVLDYSTSPTRFPIQPLQAFSAIRYVREHAEEFGICKNNIATSGFSAGGHLCACTGTLWNKLDAWFKEYGMDDVNDRVYRPDKLILCYPVIKSTSRFAHTGSIDNLLGEQAKDEGMVKLVSPDLQVDGETPPSFLWHTAEDTAVPSRNSLDFAAALTEYGILYELHVFPHAPHGTCLGTCVTNNVAYKEPLDLHEWIDKAIRFAYDEDVLKR